MRRLGASHAARAELASSPASWLHDRLAASASRRRSLPPASRWEPEGRAPQDGSASPAQIGAAFGTIISSLVGDVIMPVVGLGLGGADFSDMFVLMKEGTTAGPYDRLAAAQEAGAVTLNYGVFLNAVISFLIVAFAVFMLVRKVNQLKREEEEAPAAPPAPSNEEQLLSEIRDLLKSNA